MIDKKILYNTGGLSVDQELASATVMRLEGCPKSFASPCIINKKTLEAGAEIIKVLVPFGVVDCAKPFIYFDVHRNDIKLNKNTPITNNRVQRIEHFNFKKLGKISEHIKDKGSASFSFMAYGAHGAGKATGKVVTQFLDAFNEEIVSKYRYHSRLYIDQTASGKDNICGDLRYILHFLNVENCSSVFNRHKVDGMGVIFQIISLKSSLINKRPVSVYTLSVILSNYKENIFVLDGVNLRERVEHKYDDVLIAKKIINNSVKNNKEYIIRENKISEKSGVKPEANKWAEVTLNPNANVVVNTATYIGSTSSSTGYFYYTNS